MKKQFLFFDKKQRRTSMDNHRTKKIDFPQNSFKYSFHIQKNNSIKKSKLKILGHRLNRKIKDKICLTKLFEPTFKKRFHTEKENKIEKGLKNMFSYRTTKKTNILQNPTEKFSNSTKTSVSLQQNKLPWIIKTNPRSQEKRSIQRLNQPNLNSKTRKRARSKVSGNSVIFVSKNGAELRRGLRSRGESLGNRPFTPKCSILNRINSQLLPPMRQICEKFFEPKMIQIKSIKDRFFKFQEIGKGSYAIAYSVFDKRTKNEFVLKSLNLNLFTKKSRIRKFIVAFKMQ